MKCITEPPPLSPVIEKFRKAKLFKGDMLAEYCFNLRTPVIDHTVPLKHNEAMTLPSAELWRQAEEA